MKALHSNYSLLKHCLTNIHCFASELPVNHQVYLYDSREVSWGEGGRVVVDVRDVNVDHDGGGQWWDSTVQSSDSQ